MQPWGSECVGERDLSLVLFIYLANFYELAGLLGWDFQTLSNILPSNRNINKDAPKQPMIDLRYYWNSLVCSKLYIQHQRLTPNIDTILQVTNSLVPEQYSAGARCFTIMCGRMRHLHCFGNILQILSLKMVGALSSVVRERPHTTISGTAHA